MIYICSVDPGTTSGVARGAFGIALKDVTAWEALAAGKWESWEVEGSPAEQAWEIMDEYADWLADVQRSWTPGARVVPLLTCESFVVRLGRGASSQSNLLDPVRVASAMEALSWTRAGSRWAHINYQSPSDAKNYATNERLRAAGLWVKGSEHRRDAMRHLALAYSRALS